MLSDAACCGGCGLRATRCPCSCAHIEQQRFQLLLVHKLAVAVQLLVQGSDACVFLEGTRCGVWGARPVQCATYPFWPELMHPGEVGFSWEPMEAMWDRAQAKLLPARIDSSSVLFNSMSYTPCPAPLPQRRGWRSGRAAARGSTTTPPLKWTQLLGPRCCASPRTSLRRCRRRRGRRAAQRRRRSGGRSRVGVRRSARRWRTGLAGTCRTTACERVLPEQYQWQISAVEPEPNCSFRSRRSRGFRTDVSIVAHPCRKGCSAFSHHSTELTGWLVAGRIGHC